MIWRDSAQPLLPEHAAAPLPGTYNRYPAHPLGNGKIQTGYTSLANWIVQHPVVVIDGYAGIFWEKIYTSLKLELARMGVNVRWYDMHCCLKDSRHIQDLVAPFIGNEGDVWGTKTSLHITDFFDEEKIAALLPEGPYDLHIIYGSGAALAHPTAPVIYLDLPKNELQYRMRAGTITNFGNSTAGGSAEMYKRFYFVDWVVLNNYKQTLQQRIRIMADTQWPDHIAWAFNHDLQEGISRLARSTFRVRPWFEAGAWGGQWLKTHINGINTEEINYAWSFEMIVPENGVLFESDGYLMEIPFEWMMYTQHTAILGDHADIFQYEFPIRFDFLDTFDGGNLSIQCHPSMDYIRAHFGETFTQDETYYIMDCKDDAAVYLGFREGIDPEAFKTKLENSRDLGIPVEITDFVQKHAADKHTLFLIPNGTVHSAGANNLVLEISATPYIFTFKMYDWLRPGLDGKPRAINIDHAFHNLDFSRQGKAVKDQLISKPAVIDKGENYQLVHLPTHAEHFYDVHRLEFSGSVNITTNGLCLVMMLVEGSSVTVTTANGHTTTYHYAETFVIPAAAVSCRITCNNEGPVKLIKAFLKSSHPVFNQIAST
ncbi:class I mannose-6-phosphate isomerase [Chitinophaga sp. OAE865]|uniref:class I mannose-6-phosphate isomerase n=1 Tax=Chitinophaga sp. OAE865 TaxID=2817898 RepID=UPI001AEB4DF3